MCPRVTSRWDELTAAQSATMRRTTSVWSRQIIPKSESGHTIRIAKRELGLVGLLSGAEAIQSMTTNHELATCSGVCCSNKYWHGTWKYGKDYHASL